MLESKLKLLIENELYPLVLVNSQDELAKITINSVRISINQFIGKYKEAAVCDREARMRF